MQNEAIIMLRGKLWAVLLASVLLAACGGGHASRGRPSGSTAAPAAAPERPPDSFYAVPEPLPAGQPGTLIRAVAIAGSPQVPGSRGWVILYHSRGLDGHDVAVSGTVVAPPGASPAGGRPVLAWGHGLTGLADQCAPSHHGVIGVFGPAGSRWLGELLERGLVVAATDYQGLGTPGLARFSIGLPAGDAVLDAARAARQLPGAGASARVVLVGHSEGGHAVLWAAELAGSYAPELQVVGVAAIAPAADLTELVRLAGERPATLTSGAMVLVVAWSDAYQLPLSVLLPAGRSAAARVRSSCLDELATGPQVAAVRPADLLKVAPWPALLERNTPGTPPARRRCWSPKAPPTNRSPLPATAAWPPGCAGPAAGCSCVPTRMQTTWESSTPPAATCWPGSATGWPAGQRDPPANPEGKRQRCRRLTDGSASTGQTVGARGLPHKRGGPFEDRAGRDLGRLDHPRDLPR